MPRLWAATATDQAAGSSRGLLCRVPDGTERALRENETGNESEEVNVATPTLRVLSVCSGVGLLDLGLRLAVPGARTVCYVEREAGCVASLEARIADGSLDDAPVWGDLGTFDGRPWRGVVDCVAAGLPCQPYSVAGRQRGTADERYIWPAFFRVLEAVRAPLVFLENVPGLLKWFRPLGERLSSMGYRTEAGLFTAAEVGATHKRERLFILAYSTEWDRAELARADQRGLQGPDAGVVADNDGAGFSLERGPEAGRAEEATPRRDIDGCGGAQLGNLPLFPPGPQDHDAWAEVLAVRPDLAPATQSPVRGVAHGGARGVDLARAFQLRALGNSVVPACVALAFRTLWERIEDSK